MPEPDFDQVARDVYFHAHEQNVSIVPRIAEQLRQVWNARGAADMAKLHAELSEMIMKAALAKRLQRALLTLDR